MDCPKYGLSAFAIRLLDGLNAGLEVFYFQTEAKGKCEVWLALGDARLQVHPGMKLSDYPVDLMPLMRCPECKKAPAICRG